MAELWPPSFVFVACQHGAEGALKRELAVRAPELHPAFSRPGFVTFKPGKPCENPAKFVLPSVFARTWGFSLGAVQGDRLHDLATRAWQIPGIAELLVELKVAGIHVWERDPRMPGDDGFEPGETPLTLEVEQALAETIPMESLRQTMAERSPVPRNRWVLDVALIEPGHWFVGVHRTASRVACWAGGVPRVDWPPYAVSRAYLKMAEAVAWSALPMSRGERIAELGCAPGGASQALLDSGLVVLGLDPANVEEEVTSHPRFTHVRARAAEAPRKLFRGVPWLAADMNVAPTYTLDAVEAIVKHPATSVRGMLLTLKLANWDMAADLPAYIDRVRSWGYQDVRMRQLAFNRQEVCLAALRSRSQRRMLRTSAPQFRRDRRHASVPAPHREEPQM
jgi:23S rRNA (cytidine2498-2'-O)-methyltransferase